MFNYQSGKLQIFDVGSGELLEEVEAHTGAVWSLCMSPDRVSIIYRLCGQYVTDLTS
jgi:hypothetical protein